MLVRRRHIAAAVIAIALASSATSLTNGFTYDDRPLIAENARVHSLRAIPTLFGQTYWPERNGAALYRPLTLTSFALQWAIGGGSPKIFHAVSVLLYAAVCVLVALLLISLLTAVVPSAPALSQANGIALVAAGLFAAHPVHVEAVGNVAGQSELLVALLLTGAAILYIHQRRQPASGVARYAGVAGLFLLACLCKEHALVFPALLIAAELTVLRPPGRARIQRFAPAAMLGVAGLAFLAIRASVVGGLTGEFAHLAWGDATFGDRILTMLRVAPEWTRLLLWPAHLAGDYSPRQIEVVNEITAAVFTGVIILGATLAAAVLLWRRSPLIAFGILWIAIALLPVSNVFVVSGVLLAERTLFLPSIGLSIVIAGVLRMVMDRLTLPTASPWAPRAVAAAAAVLVLTGAIRSADRQRVWRDNSTFFAQLLKDAPLSYRAHWARGANLFDQGRKAEGEVELRRAAELFPHDPDLIEDLASRYLRAGLCAPAMPRFRQVLDMVPDRSTARMGLVACLLRDGEHRAAALEARAGLRFGTDSVQLMRLAQVADSLGGVQ